MKNNFFIGNRILYGCILFSSVFFIYFYKGYVPYALFYIVILLPIISFLYMCVIYFRFKYIQTIDEKLITKGDTIEFKYMIVNEDFLIYPYIKTTFFTAGIQFIENNENMSFPLLPFTKNSCCIKLNAKYTGQYLLGIKTIEIHDLLGLFSLKYKLSKKNMITIYPRIINIENFKLNKDYISEIDNTEKSCFEDMFNVSDIRKYVYGDSMKKIHWKLTARYNEFMVKNYHPTSTSYTNLILDLCINSIFSDDLKSMIKDQIIESTIAIANFCTKKSIPVSVFYYKNSINEIKIHNINAFNLLYKLLAEINFDSSIDMSKVLDLYLTNKTNKESMIIYTSNFNIPLLNIITKASLSGFNIKLFWVNDQYENTTFNGIDIGTLRARLLNIGIELYYIEPDDDIKIILDNTITKRYGG